mmetsp:Transcript_67142/g.108845  ORF Transcript_67142/g.108845 Transcript_67142/m.108845 type:complete len:257 (+) Transcript_67142:1559-2329(+)
MHRELHCELSHASLLLGGAALLLFCLHCPPLTLLTLQLTCPALHFCQSNAGCHQSDTSSWRAAGRCCRSDAFIRCASGCRRRSDTLSTCTYPSPRFRRSDAGRRQIDACSRRVAGCHCPSDAFSTCTCCAHLSRTSTCSAHHFCRSEAYHRRSALGLQGCSLPADLSKIALNSLFEVLRMLVVSYLLLRLVSCPLQLSLSPPQFSLGLYRLLCFLPLQLDLPLPLQLYCLLLRLYLLRYAPLKPLIELRKHGINLC